MNEDGCGSKGGLPHSNGRGYATRGEGPSGRNKCCGPVSIKRAPAAI